MPWTTYQNQGDTSATTIRFSDKFQNWAELACSGRTLREARCFAAGKSWFRCQIWRKVQKSIEPEKLFINLVGAQ